LDVPSDLATLDAWRSNGWVLLKDMFDGATLRLIDAVVEELWRSKPSDVTVDDVDAGIRTRMSDLPTRARANRIKISDLYLRSSDVRAVLLAPQLMNFLGPVLNDEPVLCNSLNLEHGSAQEFHVDSLFMTPLTRGGVIACWIALEDVRPGSGPLRLYSGSHEIPPYRFSNGGTHALEAELPDWGRYMQGELDARALQAESVYARRGDVVIWHADLVHGAEPITDRSLTRRSLVGHYFPLRDATRRGYRVKGPSSHRWIQRRPQPVDLLTRVLCGGERRAQKLRALWRIVARQSGSG
jgi:phytanoyl-CoA hydroxylase